MFLVLMLVAVSIVGYASAAGEGISTIGDSGQEVVTYYLKLTPQKKGVTTTGTARDKVASGSAYFTLSSISNGTGYALYINVRSSGGSVIVGNGATISYGTSSGQYYVQYKSGYGTVGSTYRPSAQTDSRSAYSATITGRWRP